MNELKDRQFERVLIIKPSSPGDILHALPVARGLRAAWPQARIAWLIAAPFTDLLIDEPAVDEVIPFDRKRYARVGRDWGITTEFMRFSRGLADRQFDLVIDLQGLFRSGFMARATRAGVRLGFRDARELAWVFYTHRLPRNIGDVHAAERNLQVLDCLSVPRGHPDFRPHVTDARETAARALLWEHGFSSVTQFVVLVPSTRWETKRWRPERFGELAQTLHREHGLASVLVGGGADGPAAGAAHAASGGTTINLCGHTTLTELAALIRMARLVITADSTPMHMAAAFGVPLVALFGPTNPQRTGPHGRARDVLRLDLPCSPCYLRRLEQCEHHHRCMEELDVQRVAQAAGERLQPSRDNATTRLTQLNPSATP